LFLFESCGHRFLVQVVLVILFFSPIFETVKNVPVTFLKRKKEERERDGKRETDRKKEVAILMTEKRDGQTDRQTERQTELTSGLAKDLGDAERTYERPSLGEGLD
jgi:hypothetical protein